jgi:hypothetical protein
MNISLGKIFGVVVGLISLVYIGWLLRHFVGVGGDTAEGVAFIGLGPTVIGLSIIGLLFAMPLIIKLLRATTGVNRVPGASFKPDDAAETTGFDADAAFANYMRGRDAALPPLIASDAVEDDMRPFTPRPGGFGRKVV